MENKIEFNSRSKVNFNGRKGKVSITRFEIYESGSIYGKVILNINVHGSYIELFLEDKDVNALTDLLEDILNSDSYQSKISGSLSGAILEDGFVIQKKKKMIEKLEEVKKNFIYNNNN